MSTAKSMAAQYKRQLQSRTMTPSRFKSSATNLSQPGAAASSQRLKSTSMTNLVANGEQQPPAASKIQRPASRNALDSIHMGMNAKYAQVQSKVLLQNIRPQANRSPANDSPAGSQTKMPAVSKQASAASHAFRKTNLTPTQPSGRRSVAATRATAQQQQQLDRGQLAQRVRSLEVELAKQEKLNEELRAETERAKQEHAEQLQALKTELQDKAAEHERHSEEYHHKLVEAYELADQNRRAADSVLSESRQRDEEARKRTEELEQQLAELKEFVAMKEEMAGKMSELREQIREERERYEEKTRSLNQMFENEKISPHMQVDQNSNYFKRTKNMQQSVESVNKSAEHGQLGTARPSQLSPDGPNSQFQSQQDIYGSKLSTRMHDTARSAWKLSRRFASSVITGSVGGLSACRRQCTRRRSSGASFEPRSQPAHCSPNLALPLQTEVASGQLAASSSQQHEADEHDQQQLQQQQQQLTSVIKVKANTSEAEQQLGEPTQSGSAIVIQHQPTASQPQLSPIAAADPSQKLSIVTKFGDDAAAQQPAAASSSCSSWSQPSPDNHSCPAQQQQPHSGASSNCCNERLRCESSSSGRGTSDSSSTSASCQNDVDHLDQVEQNGGATGGASDRQQQPSGDHTKRHKRKSSLLKTKKIFSGSQASLNKLRNFFSVAATNNTSKASGGKQRASVTSTVSDGQVFRDMINQSLPSSRAFDIGALEQQQQRFHGVHSPTSGQDKSAAAAEETTSDGREEADDKRQEADGEKSNFSIEIRLPPPTRQPIEG